jgi:hypothetical protein
MLYRIGFVGLAVLFFIFVVMTVLKILEASRTQLGNTAEDNMKMEEMFPPCFQFFEETTP